MIERVQVLPPSPKTTRWDPGRVMVLVAYGYAVLAPIPTLVLEPAGVGDMVFLVALYAFFGLPITTPLLLRGRVAFPIACVVTAIAVAVGGWVMMGAGLFALWPATLPLLLAATPLPHVRPPWPHVVTGVIIAATIISWTKDGVWGF